MTARSAKSGAKSGAKPAHCGPFRPDPDIPADQDGRQACARCHLIGEQGDAHHPPLPDAPEAQAAHTRRYESEET